MHAAVPIQRLSASARAPFLAHLRLLGAADRRLRFGAPLTDAAIATYVERIDFADDLIFAVHGEALDVVGAAHFAFGCDLAELGVSVLPRARGHGIGSALVARAAEYARNRATSRLFMHCLAENAAMIRIARRAGMQVIIDRGDADAHLALPPPTPLSLWSEMLADRVATYDFALKSGVETWRRIGVAMVATGRP